MEDFLRCVCSNLGDIASVFTLLGFGLAYYWNWKAEKKAKQDQFEINRLFTQAIGSIREMEIKKSQIEKARLLREADLLKFQRDTMIKRPGIDPSEKNRLENEYNLRIHEIIASSSDLEFFMTNQNFDAINDITRLLKRGAQG